MSKTPLRFGKIVATPTMHSWSQAYNAGNLVAAVSLSLPEDTKDTDISLASLGKELLSDLEAEYFTLENKNLQTIKKAVQTICEKFSQTAQVSFCIGVLIENILYVYMYGTGKIVMKRGEALGTLLEQNTNDTLSSASGFIQDKDIVVLQTQQFMKTIPQEELHDALMTNSLSDMTDILSPKIHQTQQAGAAALAFLYHETTSPVATDELPPVAEVSEPVTRPESIQTESEVKQEYTPRHFSLSHARKLYTTIAVIIGLVLIASIFLFIKKQQQQNTQNLFTALIIPAQKKYDEGVSLMDLNQSLATADFTKAKQMVQDGLQKLPKGSSQATQAQDLLTKITSNLSTTPTPTGQKVDTTTSKFLQIISAHADATAFTQDDKTVYVANPTGIIAVNKADATEKTIIKNTSDWKHAEGLSTYLGNFYVLDTADGINKYTPTGSSYTKSAYFSTSTPDLSKAMGITIDGSIWIVSTDGTITKYTKGKQDSLTLSGFTTPLKNPSQIFTSSANTYVYILDNGNGRIIVMDTTGKFVAQYPSAAVTAARAFEVLEKDKKIYVLSGGNEYEVDMK